MIYATRSQANHVTRLQEMPSCLRTLSYGTKRWWFTVFLQDFRYTENVENHPNLPPKFTRSDLSNAQTFYKTTEEINMWQTVVFKFCLFYQWVRTICTYFRHPLWPTTRLLLKAIWIYSMFSCAQTMLLPLQPYSLFIGLSLTPFGRVTISQKSLNIPVT